MGVRVKVDERGRITIPTEIRDSLGIGANTELILEKRWNEVVLLKPLSPEEFIKQAHEFMKEVEAFKVETLEPLKVKEIWREKP
ncbi:MAG: hypothetical protein AOA65_0054 [Candidatus Bathyarchaeota archaeon BA1]|nr:MAG: hypothetical protein AOA65_0054 [Candidatus Bathyarchaeota archaeon BA1]